MSSQGTWVRGEIYAAGEHIGTYENDLTTPTTFFTHSDHLGTERVETAVNGSSCETITNTAFGDGMNEAGSCDPTALRFTGKLRDYETNLDDFGARYYSSQLARFMVPDWAARPTAVPYAVFGDPQSLNLYGYVRNDPVSRADADGHAAAGATGDGPGPPPTISEDSQLLALARAGSFDVCVLEDSGCDGVAAKPLAQDISAKAATAATDAQTPQQKQDQPPSQQDYLNAIATGAASADNFIKKVELPAVAPEYAAAGGAVVAGEGVTATGTVAAVGNAVKTAANTVGDAASVVGQAGATAQLRVGVAIETAVPGGVAAVSQFVQAAIRPTSAARTTAGMLGLLANATYKAVKQFF